MSSIIRIRNSVMEGLLPELLAGIAPELEKYPQQLRLTMIPPVYGEAVQSNHHSCCHWRNKGPSRKFLVTAFAVNLALDDIEGVGETAGGGVGDGFARATVEAEGVVMYTNKSSAPVPITASGLTMSDVEYAIAATQSASAFVDFAYGATEIPPDTPLGALSALTGSDNSLSYQFSATFRTLLVGKYSGTIIRL